MKTKKLGLWTLTALVVGNMIGTGIFLLPADLAQVGSISLLSWGVTAVGAFLLALVFSRMSLLVPKAGGPYAYAEAGMGKFIGFQTAYNYWVATWVSNAAIVLGLLGYLIPFCPILHVPEYGGIFCITMIWFLTFINLQGVHAAGKMQLVTAILKFVPIAVILLFGWHYLRLDYLTNDFNRTTGSNWHAFSHAATLTLWSFLGLESATVPADHVENPRRNIPLATLIGTLIAATAYIVSSSMIMSMMPLHVLAHSTAPFADAASIIFGQWGRYIVAAGAAVSCLGCLNGWILLQGQVAMAAADNGLFPKVFAKRNQHGAPVWGLIITALLITALLMMTMNHSLLKQFEIIILIGTLACLIPYFYTTTSALIIYGRTPTSPMAFVVAIFAMLYSFWTILASDATILFYGCILLFSSAPVYAWVIYRATP